MKKVILISVLALFLGACGSNSYKSRQDNNRVESASQTNSLTQGEVSNKSYFFKEADKEQSYALYIPKRYDGANKYPLVVLLHGYGSNPNQIMKYQGILTEAEKRGYVLAAPYGYNERGWYGSQGKGKGKGYEGRGGRHKGDPENLGELSEKDVMNVLKIVQTDLSIDSNRIFLLGHSMGGAGALHLAATYPDAWNGLACLAPAFKGELSSLEKLKQLPVFVATGDKDRLVPVRSVRRWVNGMKSLDMDVVYKEIEGGGHFRTITRNPELISEAFDFFEQYGRSTDN